MYRQPIGKIKAFFWKHKRLPSYSEILDITQYKSTKTVYDIISQMEGEGLVRRDAKNKIVPTDKLDAIPLLGQVEAGFPTSADSQLAVHLSLDDYLIPKNRESTYLLKVSGDSMAEAGILPGDLVMVERGKTPKVGDIVVARVDNQWTLKYLATEKGQFCLVPANGNYKTIYPDQELQVEAVVVGMIRKYGNGT